MYKHKEVNHQTYDIIRVLAGGFSKQIATSKEDKARL